MMSCMGHKILKITGFLVVANVKVCGLKPEGLILSKTQNVTGSGAQPVGPIFRYQYLSNISSFILYHTLVST